MTRTLVFAALVRTGCSSPDVYRQASEDLLRPQPLGPGFVMTKRWIYEGPETDVLPWHRKARSMEEVEACLTVLARSAPRSSHASPAAEITHCMAEKRWHIELKRNLIIILQSAG